MRFDIVETRAQHIRELARRMRSEDRSEMFCAGCRPLNTLWGLWRDSSLCRTALLEGRVVAVWGCEGTALETEGRPWLFTTPIVELVPITFYRQTQMEVAEMLATRRRLSAHVLASYDRSVAFFSRLGFTASEPFGYGASGPAFFANLRSSVRTDMGDFGIGEALAIGSRSCWCGQCRRGRCWRDELCQRTASRLRTTRQRLLRTTLPLLARMPKRQHRLAQEKATEASLRSRGVVGATTTGRCG